MTFDPKIVEALNADLSPKAVKQRSQAGRNLSYIEGWWAIAEANRIFGFDGWTRETVDLRLLFEPYDKDGKCRVGYSAKVRVTVHGVIREGTGYGSGIAKDAGDAHESAIKEAETDAMKRALMTFGWPFGLALYDKDQEHVADKPKTVDVVDAPHKSPMEKKKSGEWKGPLMVTALKNALKALIEDVKACTDAAELAGMEVDNKAVLEQAEVDLPDWYEAAMKVIRQKAHDLMNIHNPLEAA
jgi:DNA repair and recombination protein RAD52